MNFGFNLEWPPYVGSVVGILASAAAVIGALVAGVLMMRRLILAWRNWGKPVALGAFASRADLLNESMPVVGLREGKEVGRAFDVILDLQTGCVAGFRVRARWHKRLLPFERVKSIGRDAITVESAAELQVPDTLPALAALANSKYRWEECEVVTEAGSKLGTASWPDLWYNRLDGVVELAIETSHHSMMNGLLSWAIELASVFQPIDDWIGQPAKLSVRAPLRAFRAASRRMIILSTEGEAQFQSAMQTQARQTRESVDNFLGKLKDFMNRRWRGCPRPSPSPGLSASAAAPQSSGADRKD